MASELDVLLDKVSDPALRADLKRQVELLRSKRRFGLVFEEHLPERAQLPDHSVRRGTRVVLRDHDADEPREVVRVAGGKAAVRSPEGVIETLAVGDLVVVADFGEPIYPGLRRLGSLKAGGDKPAHVVIKGENHHVLEALQFTHAGKVDCIYIDPPYNTGARDWKYSNDYVDANDRFRHSKWLSFMERRLHLAKSLLKPASSTLLITIDDNEVYSVGLLLDQVFHGCERQMVSITVSPRGKSRVGRLSQVDEYMFVVYIGEAAVLDVAGTGQGVEVRWRYLRRNDVESARGTVKGGPSQFYPIYVDAESGRVARIGDPLKPDDPLTAAPSFPGTVPVFPIREDGLQMNWGLTGPSLQRALDDGYVRVSPGVHENQPFTFAYLTMPNIKRCSPASTRSAAAALMGRRSLSRRKAKESGRLRRGVRLDTMQARMGRGCSAP